MSLDDLRKEIDKIDRDLILLFEKRMNIIKEVKSYKEENNLPLKDENREKEAISSLKKEIGREYGFVVDLIYSEIFKISRNYMRNLYSEYGLIGKSLVHSKSKEIHESLSENKYNLISLNEEDLDEFFRIRNFKGINVTIPYKVKVMKYLDYIDEEAEKIGSINTIVKRNNKLFGYNTDYLGLEYLCKKEKINVKDKKVLILGSGGSSKTVKRYLENKNAKYAIISRSGENNYSNLEKFKDFQIIINTTPVGMYPNNLESKININLFKNLEALIDLIYNPIKTRLILDAENSKIKAVSGLSMLVAQAFYAEELFLDKKLKEEVIEDVILKIKKNMENIILVGMPGAGKTTIAIEIAKRLNRKFVDIDKEIEKREGPIGEIFRNKGEEVFRKIEKEILREVTKEKGLVISTGGGAVLDFENQLAIRQNGFIVLINRELEKLDLKGRPLSKDYEGLRILEKERMPIYKSIKNIEVKNMENNIALTVDKIIKEYNK